MNMMKQADFGIQEKIGARENLSHPHIAKRNPLIQVSAEPSPDENLR